MSPQNLAFIWLTTLIQDVPVVVVDGNNNNNNDDEDGDIPNDWVSTYTDLELVQHYSLATLFFATQGLNWTVNDNWLEPNISMCDWAYMGDILDEGICTTDTTGLVPSSPAAASGDSGGEGDGYNDDNHQRERHRRQRRAATTTTRSTSRGPYREQRRIQQSQNMITSLRLFDNGLDGSMVPELALLSDSLVELRIGRNPGLTGELPSVLGRLSRLESFSADQCDLSGSMIPSEYGSGLTNLLSFSLGGNRNLGGSIPSTIGSWTSLTELRHPGTPLGGSFPTEIGMVSSLHFCCCIGHSHGRCASCYKSTLEMGDGSYNSLTVANVVL